VIRDGALLIRGGILEQVGPTRRVENLAAARGAKEIDATGRIVLPGLVDSHTHLFYPPPGERGATEEGAAAAIRANSAWLLEARLEPYLEAMVRHGTTTVEVKTGCGPDIAVETKALRVLAGLRASGMDVTPTFLLRVPEDASEVEVARIVTDVAPRICGRSTARFADLYWDNQPARHGLYARYLQMAAANGLPFKVHADGPGCAGAVALAVGHRATSVDHLEHMSLEQTDLLANSRTVATLLPTRALYGAGSMAPARALIESGGGTGEQLQPASYAGVQYADGDGAGMRGDGTDARGGDFGGDDQLRARGGASGPDRLAGAGEGRGPGGAERRGLPRHGAVHRREPGTPDDEAGKVRIPRGRGGTRVAVRRRKELLCFFQFDDHHFDRLRPRVLISVPLETLRNRQPVSLARVPWVHFGSAVLIDHFHGSTRQRDDDPRMLVRVHGQRRVRRHYCLPDGHFLVFKLESPLRSALKRRTVLRSQCLAGRKEQSPNRKRRANRRVLHSI
jgi:imidazolonepropionase